MFCVSPFNLFADLFAREKGFSYWVTCCRRSGILSSSLIPTQYERRIKFLARNFFSFFGRFRLFSATRESFRTVISFFSWWNFAMTVSESTENYAKERKLFMRMGNSYLFHFSLNPFLRLLFINSSDKMKTRKDHNDVNNFMDDANQISSSLSFHRFLMNISNVNPLLLLAYISRPENLNLKIFWKTFLSWESCIVLWGTEAINSPTIPLVCAFPYYEKIRKDMMCLSTLWSRA